MATVAPGWTRAGAEEFAEFIAPLSNWGRWGDDDELGTVNLLTPERIASAAASVCDGECVSLARLVSVRREPDNPNPIVHLMKTSGDAAPDFGGTHASDWLGIGYHGFAVTHIDALSHQFFNGRMYNGRPAARVSTRSGAGANSVMPLAAGLVGRGVLLDVPRTTGRDWLEPGEGIGPAELDAAAAAQDVTLAPGDLVLVRFGRDARAGEHGIRDPRWDGSAGLTRAVLPWLREHDVAVLGSDSVSDVVEPGLPSHPMPVHAGALAFLGLPLLDNLVLDGLAASCAGRGRWEFLLTVAPLALSRFTGSPVNPIAVF